MERFILFRNGKVVGKFNSERTARLFFLELITIADFRDDDVVLVDLELDGKSIACY